MKFILGIIFAVSAGIFGLTYTNTSQIAQYLDKFYALIPDPNTRVIPFVICVSILIMILISGIGNKIYFNRYKRIARLTKEKIHLPSNSPRRYEVEEEIFQITKKV